MTRVLLLSIGGAAIFLGFALPFIVRGTTGLIAAGVVVLIGALLIFVIERRSRHRLEKDSAWNSVMRAAGDDLLDRQDSGSRDDTR